MVRHPTLALSLLLSAAALTGCASGPAETARPIAAEPAARSSCAGEAEQLTSPAAVHAEPATASALLAELEGGRFVYRCERRGEWLAIMFPAAGEPVDCTRRAAAQACAIGWIEGDVETELYG